MMNIDFLINKAKKQNELNNILFLDFDGVINIPNRKNNLANYDCIKNLNILCEKFNFKIVISSSYRYNGINFCKDYLYKSGLNKNIKIIGTTKTDKIDYRYNEIIDFLQNINYSGFLILDDLDMYYMNHFLIKTNPLIGFDKDKLNEAINKFKSVFLD